MFLLCCFFFLVILQGLIPTFFYKKRHKMKHFAPFLVLLFVGFSCAEPTAFKDRTPIQGSDKSGSYALGLAYGSPTDNELPVPPNTESQMTFQGWWFNYNFGDIAFPVSEVPIPTEGMYDVQYGATFSLPDWQHSQVADARTLLLHVNGYEASRSTVAAVHGSDTQTRASSLIHLYANDLVSLNVSHAAGNSLYVYGATLSLVLQAW
jgi:hypothetical protein